MTKEARFVPKRRFREFEGAEGWEQRTIGELCKEFQSGESINASSISSVGNYPVYGGNGLRGYTETYNHEGEFALIGRQGALCGNMQYFCGKAYFTEHAIAAKANNENDTRFLYYLFTIMNLGQYSGQSAQPGLAVRNLVKLNVLVPVKAEQSKIASLFRNLDNLITFHQRKLEKTKALKSAYLSEMFPAEGEKKPRRRFVGFTGDWEEHRLTDVVKLFNGLTYSPNNVIKDGGTLVLRSSNIKDGEIINADNVYVKSDVVNVDNVQEGDVIIVVRNGSRSLIGKHAQVKIKMEDTVIGAFMTGMRSSNPSFINALLSASVFNKEVEKNLGATINQITNAMFQNMYFMFPSKEEQIKIGDCFCELDNLITLHQRKLEKLQNLKKAYLNEMFV